MDEKHVPVIGPRYWAFFLVASIFGAVVSDVLPVALPIGAPARLMILAALIATVFIAEFRDRSTSDVWYWIALVLIQITAVRLGDLSTISLGLNPFLMAGALSVLLVTTMVMAGSDDAYLYATMQLDRPGTEAKPRADVGHWLGMMLSSTLAAVAADICSITLGIGLPLSVTILSLAIAALLWMRRWSKPNPLIVLWLTVILMRCDGVVIGDLMIGWLPFNFGLTICAVFTGCLAVGLFVLWRPSRSV